MLGNHKWVKQIKVSALKELKWGVEELRGKTDNKQTNKHKRIKWLKSAMQNIKQDKGIMRVIFFTACRFSYGHLRPN